MRQFAIIVAFLLATCNYGFAQKVAIIDADAVLQEMPAYKQAQAQLDRMVENWRKEVENRHKEIDELYKKYQAEQVLLSESDRKRREEEIVNRETELREFQKQKFGPSGELGTKRQELVKPIQDEVYTAIETVSTRKKIDIVLDKGNAHILFFNAAYDLTQDIMKELGLETNK